MTRGARRWPAISLALASCLSALATPARPSLTAVFEPDGSAPGAARLEGATWLGGTAGYSVRIKLMDAGERQAFIRETTGGIVDPFASRPDVPERFMTFKVEIDNRGTGQLSFQPRTCWLVTPRPRVYAPIGLEDLRTSYGMLGHELPPTYEHARPAVLESSRTLNPGDSLAGLLVFRAPDARTKRFRLDFEFVLADGQPSKLSAPYRRAKRKR